MNIQIIITVLRKGLTFCYKPCTAIQRSFISNDDYLAPLPIIVNILPKSGTHLLLQVTKASLGSLYRGNSIATIPTRTLKARSAKSITISIRGVFSAKTLGDDIYHSSDERSAYSPSDDYLKELLAALLSGSSNKKHFLEMRYKTSCKSECR